MAKIEKKSIAELVAARTKKPTPEEIDNITQKIHVAASATVVEPVIEPIVVVAPPVVAVVESSPTLLAVEEEIEVMLEQMVNTKRISVNATIPLYIKAKTKATMQGKTLMAYIIGLMEKDVKDMK
jgi:hypothetical protein